MAMQLGLSLAEYEAYVGPANKYYHELAESIIMQKEGILPIDEDPDIPGVDDSIGKKRIR